MGGRSGNSGGISGAASASGRREELENVLTFNDGKEVDAYFRDIAENWGERILQEEYDDTKEYTGGIYRKFNDYLRKGGQYSHTPADIAKYEAMQRRINSAISKFYTRDNIRVVRGDSMSALPEWARNDPRRLIGEEYVDRGMFSSTPSTKDAWKNTVMFEVNVPRGYGRGAYVSFISNFHSEKEYLIHSNSRHVVRNVRQEGNRWIISMDMIE